MAAKILYIEDNPLNLRLIRKILHSIGMDMVEALDGATGLAVLAREKPDLVLVDLMMPGMDGTEVVSRIKADPELAPIPVIMLTASTLRSERRRCLSAGCDGFLTKPVSRLELKEVIEQHLRNAGQLTA